MRLGRRWATAGPGAKLERTTAIRRRLYAVLRA
jgi:hypothetical protein